MKPPIVFAMRFLPALMARCGRRLPGQPWLHRATGLAVAAIGAALLAGSAPGVAQTSAPGVLPTSERTLDNGMKVIVREDRRAPVVVSMVWYRVGSVDEVSGTTGLAHVVEHMMFRGTRRRPDGEFSRLVAEIGGRDNAFVSRDFTAFHQQVHRMHLPLLLELEADRMTNLTLSPDAFAKEMQVVMEERRWRTDDRPRALLAERLWATAFSAHPYRHPVIGWMSDLESMTVEDAREFYRRWYAPNNATLVVVGDVDADEVFRLAAQRFGSIPARPLARRRAQTEPPQNGIKRVTLQAPAQLGFGMFGWHAPALRPGSADWEPLALELLEWVLGGNESARLPRALVRDARVASSVDVRYDAAVRGPGFFVIAAAPAEGRSVAEIESVLRATLARLVRDGVDAEELDRARTQIAAQQVFARDSAFFQANQIGRFEKVGLGWRSAEQMLERMRVITAAQVREVAARVLVDDRLTVAVLEPQPHALPKKQPAGPPPGLRHVD